MNVPLIAGSGTMLKLVPRTSSSRTSWMGTGCANVSENVRLSRSADSARSSSCVSGSAGIVSGRLRRRPARLRAARRARGGATPSPRMSCRFYAGLAIGVRRRAAACTRPCRRSRSDAGRVDTCRERWRRLELPLAEHQRAEQAADRREDRADEEHGQEADRSTESVRRTTSARFEVVAKALGAAHVLERRGASFRVPSVRATTSMGTEITR